MAVVGVYMDWDGDGFDTGANDAVTTYVQSWSITRGAGPEIIGGSQPGGCIIRLKNTSDRFNPFYAAGPLYGKLTDGVPVWIGVTDDGKVSGSTANGLFGGRITDISLIPGEGTSVAPEVEIICEDALGWYRRMDCRVFDDEGRSHAAFRELALQLASYDVTNIVLRGETRYVLDAEIETMPISHADAPLLDVLDAINAVTGTRHFVKPADLYTDWYNYTTRNRQYGLTGTATASLSASSNHVTGSDGWRLTADTVTNRQRATVSPVSFTPATYTVWQQDPLPLVINGDDGIFVKFVDFEDVVFGAQVNMDYTGTAPGGTLTPFGSSFRIQFNNGAGNTTTFSHLSIEGRLVRRLPNETYEANDTTSQAVNARGMRNGSDIGNEYLGVLAEARGIAGHVVWRYGSPQLRPTLDITNWMPYMFQLDLYDTIAFTSTQLGMSARIFEIVGITLEGLIASSSVQHHTVRYVLQECKVQSNPHWFTWDSSNWNGTDVLQY